MSQIETHKHAAFADTVPFRAYGTLAAHFFRQIGNRLSAPLPAQNTLSQPEAESHLLWDHGMTRRDISSMLDRLHR